MRALVTGGCGFVGGHLIRHLLDSGDTVLGTARDLERVADLTAQYQGSTWQTLEITDPKAVLHCINTYRPEVIYHLAGIAFVPDAEENFESALSVNVAGTHHVARACHLLQTGIKVVLISSAETYGRISPSDLPITEKTPTRPSHNYSLSKLMAEQVLERFTQYGQMKGVVIRPFNHIGPGQSDKFVASNFASQLVRMKAGRTSPVIRVGNLAAKRDFSDVRDIVRCYRLAAEKGEGIYNLGTGRAVSINLLLETLIAISGLKVSIETDPARMRPAEIPEIYGIYEKAKRELGWESTYSLRETLESVYRDHELRLRIASE